MLHVLKSLCSKGKEITIRTVCELRRTSTISINTWNGKLNLPYEVKMQLRKDYLKLKLIWKLEDGNRKFQKQLLKLIENLNLKGYSYIKRTNGRIRLKERRSVSTLSSLRRFQEFGIIFLWNVTELYRRYCWDRKENRDESRRIRRYLHHASKEGREF